MIARLATLMVLTLAQPVHALSCLRPSIADAYAFADQDPGNWIVFRGKMTLRSGHPLPLEKAEQDGSLPEGQERVVVFDGLRATTDGFSVPVKSNGMAAINCVAHWCGGLPQGPSILFLRETEDMLRVELDACTRFAFPDTAENRRAVMRCVAGGCGG